jgi:hypothetical protein
MNTLSRHERIQFIKSFKHPPLDRNDIYFLRSPWNKFGGVSSGINMAWCWYRDDCIDASDHEVEVAYNEIKNFYEEITL